MREKSLFLRPLPPRPRRPIDNQTSGVCICHCAIRSPFCMAASCTHPWSCPTAEVVPSPTRRPILRFLSQASLYCADHTGYLFPSRLQLFAVMRCYFRRRRHLMQPSRPGPPMKHPRCSSTTFSLFVTDLYPLHWALLLWRAKPSCHRASPSSSREKLLAMDGAIVHEAGVVGPVCELPFPSKLRPMHSNVGVSRASTLFHYSLGIYASMVAQVNIMESPTRYSHRIWPSCTSGCCPAYTALSDESQSRDTLN